MQNGQTLIKRIGLFIGPISSLLIIFLFVPDPQNPQVGYTAAMASSFAFMMPIATPPNAIIFGTNRIRIPDMVKVGFIINILGIIVLTAGIMLLGGLLDIDYNYMPEWAK